MSSLEQAPEQANILPPTDNDDKRVQNKRKLLITMLHPFKELLVAVLIAITYAALTNNSPPKVSKPPAAYPFFSPSSPVKDWYRGEISWAIEQARSSDLAFVMFYAPWDAQSQATRHQFELAADLMGDQVTFVAINCWQPGSECKSQYSKVYRWPVLIAYPTHGRGVQYNGPLTAPHMARFLRHVCKPLVLLQSIDDLLIRSDAVVFAMVNALPGSYDYAAFYLTALRYLERDPFRDVSFAVLPQSADQERLLSLYLWNETKVFGGQNWTPDSLLMWINKNLHQITTWMSPTGTKSLSLANYVQKGAALLLFTPRNPFFQQTDYYDMLKEMAYEYYNCGNNEDMKIKQKLVQLNRYKNYIQHQELKQKCSKLPKNSHLPHTKLWTNTTNCQNCCECNLQCNKYKTSMLYDLNGKLIRAHNEEKCKTLYNGENFHCNIFIQKSANNFKFNITGLHCNANSSLIFLAMDSLEYYHFAEKLGIDLSRAKHKTAAVLVNENTESHYILQNVDELNLRKFVYNFTENSLDRALNSSNSVRSMSSHSFPLVEKCLRHFCVTELDSSNFLTETAELHKAVLVFYYSKQCAFCSGIAHVFLATANLFKSVENIKFARIDGDLNLLPWEYTMDIFPTFLFFPANKKSESRVFPRSLPVTVPNLTGFLLANLEPNLKLKAMWTVCNQTVFSDEKCISSVRAEILSIIDLTLKQWRVVDNRRKPEILHKLQVLRQLHLLFAHSPGRLKLIDNYLNKFDTGLRFKDEL